MVTGGKAEQPRVVIHDEALRERLLRLGRRGEFLANIRRMIEREAPQWVNEIKARLDVPYKAGEKTGPFPRRRTGALQDAIRHKIDAREHQVGLQLGIFDENPVYARLHELGKPALIHRGQKRLAIPTDAARDARGVPKFSPWSARNFYEATWARYDIVYGRRGKLVEKIFVLADVTRTVRRPYIAPTLETMVKRLREMVHEAYRQTASTKAR